MNKYYLLTGLIFLSLFNVKVHSAEVRIATDFRETDKSQIACLRRAEEVLWYKGFTYNLQHDKESAWGGLDQGTYKAVIKCIEDSSLRNSRPVLFVVAGPDGVKTRKYVKQLYMTF